MHSIKKLFFHQTVKPLISLFMLTTSLGIYAIEAPSDEELESAGLLGAGTMGGGIAWLLSRWDIPVRVKDLDPGALGAGLKEAYRIHERRKKRRRLTAWELDKKMSLLSLSCSPT